MNLARLGILVTAMIPALATAASVELAAFTDRLFCEKVMTSLRGQTGSDSELWKTVKWTPVDLKGQGPVTRRCSSFDKARMDLDNDGREDLVVRATFCMKSVPSDSLYVFPADRTVPEEASWQDTGPLLATHDKFERTGGTYPLTALRINQAPVPPALTTAFSLQPFLLDGTAYVGLTDTRREWMVIAKYRGGERFEDLCYVHMGSN